ncbi:MAG: serine hydrolase domain-containing protein [Nesterenkonia sp.]
MDSVAALLQKHVDAGALPGAVAVRFSEGSAATVTVGTQDMDSDTPMSAQTLFLWDSLTKPLTAALALTFVAEALITSLQEGPAPRTLDRESFLKAAAELPLAHQPGRGWTYNTGSTLLGLLLERIADQPLDELMAQRLTEPLRMQSTRWWVPPSRHAQFAGRYQTTGESGAPLKLIDPADGRHAAPPSFPDGAGGLIGTAEDWLAFGRMLLDGGESRGRRILPEWLVEAMMTDQLTAEQRRQAGFFFDEGEGWGFGGSVRADGSYGWAGGAGTTARVDPRRRRIAVAFTQVALSDPAGSALLRDVEGLLLAENG